ncbi:uncharacterized protein H6S33_007038 [Morchella sextelata]|uniref:uncharacterized protein n=1 Tax=Morchella sextelata TaxID=1174677 RepID=UPI001D04D1F1|nr:uncharacterized protein H6S33_007038 [Morchella sextelata]KAH0604007.1 hypothetical protein H6S33_007038 [Morchella sextelata]
MPDDGVVFTLLLPVITEVSEILKTFISSQDAPVILQEMLDEVRVFQHLLQDLSPESVGTSHASQLYLDNILYTSLYISLSLWCFLWTFSRLGGSLDRVVVRKEVGQSSGALVEGNLAQLLEHIKQQKEALVLVVTIVSRYARTLQKQKSQLVLWGVFWSAAFTQNHFPEAIDLSLETSRTTHKELLAILLQYATIVRKTLRMLFYGARAQMAPPSIVRFILPEVQKLRRAFKKLYLSCHSATCVAFQSKITQVDKNHRDLFILSSCGVTLSYAIVLLRQLPELNTHQIAYRTVLGWRTVLKWRTVSQGLSDVLVRIENDTARIMGVTASYAQSDINSSDPQLHGFPLLIAVAGGDVTKVQTLPSHGAEINQCHPMSGDYALQIATTNGSEDVTGDFIVKSAIIGGNAGVITRLHETESSLISIDSELNALSFAIELNKESIVDLFLDTSLVGRGEVDQTQLIAALHHAILYQHENIIANVLKRGALPDETAIRLAGRTGKADILKLLAGDDRETTNPPSGEETLPRIGVECGDIKAVRELVGAGADINETTSDGETSEALARRGKHKEIQISSERGLRVSDTSS